MKRIFVLLFITLCASSCVVLSPKKYKSLVAQRDSLSSALTGANNRITSLEDELARLRSDTALLHSEIAGLSSKVSGLNSNNASLRAASDRLSQDLKKREARLREVEEILRKRDEATLALKDKLQKALLGFQQSGLSVEIRSGKVYVSLTDKLLFSTGSIVIDEKGKQALAGLATVLNTQPEINISVEGHTDNQRVVNLGQIKDNWDLSVLRATSVVRYLTEAQKIESTRITATGKGQFQPIEDVNTPEARSRNRRIEIVLSPKLDELYDLIK
ncbi:OmpA family protein [Arcticibacter sp. MXS-1]|uniref:OmpA/MotB family protein n=1 Tax=Arcticibacter sp. MXS-1 TaxID=3341726 RepID=UPI0035A86149